MSRLKVAVVGVGHLGQHHARILANNARCELVGVVDINLAAAQKIARSWNAAAFGSHTELLEKTAVEAVSIAVPTSRHHAVARDFLMRGVHCMVEKPITTTVEDAEDLIRLAEENNCVLQVGHIEHYNAAVRKLEEILDRPAFIECHRLGPFVSRVSDVGVVLDLMIHDIDIVLQIVKSPIVSMDAVGVNILTDKEDIANVRMKFENGCTANLTVSRVSPKPQRKIRVFQKDTYVSIDCANQSMEVYQRIPRLNAPKGEAQADIVRRRLRLKKEDMLTLELDDYVTAVVERRAPKVTGVHARDALSVAVRIARMIAANKVQEKFG